MALNPANIVHILSNGSILVRVGIAIASVDAMESLPMLGVQWDVTIVDIVERWFAKLPSGTRFAGINRATLLAELSAIANETLDRRCAMVANVDVFLAKLSEDERAEVWSFLFTALKKRPTALLLVLPAAGVDLLPAGEIERWRSAGRLIEAFEV